MAYYCDAVVCFNHHPCALHAPPPPPYSVEEDLLSSIVQTIVESAPVYNAIDEVKPAWVPSHRAGSCKKYSANKCQRYAKKSQPRMHKKSTKKKYSY